MNPVFLTRAHFAAICAALLLVLLPLCAQSQTLTIDNDIQTYSTLTNTTVTTTGRSELRITGSGTPMTGCTINLN